MNDRIETNVPHAARLAKPAASALAKPAASAARARAVAPDCAGLDFHALDHNLRDLLPLYMDAPLLAHLTPHLQALGSGSVSGKRLT